MLAIYSAAIFVSVQHISKAAGTTKQIFRQEPDLSPPQNTINSMVHAYTFGRAQTALTSCELLERKPPILSRDQAHSNNFSDHES